MYDRKGEPSAVLAAVGLLVLSLVFGMMSLPVNSYFSDNLDTSVKDLDRMADTKAYGELYFYNYVPTAALYTTYQNTYEMAKQGGGPNVDWDYEIYKSSSNNIPYNRIPGNTCSTLPIIGEISCKLNNEVEQDLNNMVTSGQAGRCERPDYSLGVWFEENPYSLKGNIFAANPIQVNCDLPDGQTMYKANDSFLNLEFDATGNRYLKMAEEANRTLYQIYDNWQSVDKYVGKSTKQCSIGHSDFSTAEDNALSSANQKVNEGVYNVISSGTNYKDMVYDEVVLKGPSQNLDYGATSNNFSVKQTHKTRNDVGSCCASTNGTCYDWEDQAKVTLTVQKSNLKLVLKDKFSKVPVNSGKRYMEFIVDPYNHDFTDD
ncbi:hypothetical protein [Candidatus Nanohalovita haloferacivicina]|uniref:hypothetical protein n=1 Tax=Candidatus Nanohalovita haloferacivicina TaxID=2978046 RepID=UPI00325FD0AA|nr:hypothetical protein HBNXNv_1070 [Candidatus Nanohalobia archaeon BNXNv]